MLVEASGEASAQGSASDAEWAGGRWSVTALVKLLASAWARPSVSELESRPELVLASALLSGLE
ncbi:MAG TPA: hypothetical protein VF146_06785 [Bryobacteraceae bacterium]